MSKIATVTIILSCVLFHANVLAGWRDDAAQLDSVKLTPPPPPATAEPFAAFGSKAPTKSGTSSAASIQNFIDNLSIYTPSNGNACINTSPTAVKYDSNSPSAIYLCGSQSSNGATSTTNTNSNTTTSDTSIWSGN